MSHPLITRLVIRNFRSIARCVVDLGPLTFVLGPNDAGKSNFLDALRFVADSLRHSVDRALGDRGGINEVRQKSSGDPTNFGIRLDFDLPRATGRFAFEIAPGTNGRYDIEREQCTVRTPGMPPFHYLFEGGEVSSNIRTPPAPAAGQFYLVRASGDAAFRPVHDALARMGFYNFDPDSMRRTRLPAADPLLHRDGRNIASILFRLQEHSPENKRTIEEYLAAVARGIVGVNPQRFGPEEGLQFLKKMDGAQHPEEFHSVGMSDGTLRTLGVLTALFQNSWDPDARQLIGIEEPESALHPLAAGALIDSLRDASQNVQVLVTSHSPDLLDDKHIQADQLLAATARDGRTGIGPIDEAGRNTLRKRLCTPGELLRIGQVRPDPKAIEPDNLRLRLFG